MALLMMDGFDCYGTTSTLWNDTNWAVAWQRNWDTRGTINTGYLGSPAFTTGRGPGLALLLYSDSGNTIYLQRNIGTPASTTAVLVFSYQWSINTGSSATAIVTLLDSAGTEMGHLYSTGPQLVYRNGSGTNILTTTATAMVVNTWYTVELLVTAGTTTGYVEIHIDGTAVGSATNVNTVGAANTSGMQSLRLGPVGVTANFNTFALDHLIVMDGTGSALNTFLGERRIVTLVPNGVGSHSDWTAVGATPNWACVDEAGIDQDTTRVVASTIGNTDTYTLSELPSTTQSVYALQVSGYARRDDLTARQIRFLVRSASTDALIGSSAVVNTDYTARLLAIATQNPVTTAAWTNSDIASLQAGARVTV